MICKNCSGEYSNNLLKCPYCDTENKEIASQLKKDILHQYDREADLIRKEAEQFPEKTAHKWTKYIVRGVMIAAIAGILLTIFAILIGKLAVSLSFKGEEKHLEKLEELYQNEDYEGIREYIKKKDLYDSTYKKYSQIDEIVYDYEQITESLDFIQRNMESDAMTQQEKIDSSHYWIENILKSSASVLSQCKEYTEDMIFLENEDRLLAIYDECVKQLEDFGFAQEEIAWIENWNGESDLGGMVKILENNFFGVGE